MCEQNTWLASLEQQDILFMNELVDKIIACIRTTKYNTKNVEVVLFLNDKKFRQKMYELIKAHSK